MQTLSQKHWFSCFDKILFPLVKILIQPDWTITPPGAPPGTPKIPPPSAELEETRIRAMNLLTKVFLQHLGILSGQKTSFKHVWLQILNFMGRYMNIGRGETLAEAIPEALKNALFVMNDAKVFDENSSIPANRKISNDPETTDLWSITWQKIDMFLPKLHANLYNLPAPAVNLNLKAPEVHCGDLKVLIIVLSNSGHSFHNPLPHSLNRNSEESKSDKPVEIVPVQQNNANLDIQNCSKYFQDSANQDSFNGIGIGNNFDLNVGDINTKATQVIFEIWKLVKF